MDNVGKDDVPISIPRTSNELSSGATSLVPFSRYNDNNSNEAQKEHMSISRKVLNVYGLVKGCLRGTLSLMKDCPLDPHKKAVKKWNQFIAISCLFAIFMDPLFFYLLSVEKGPKCIVLNWPMTKTIVVLRSITDFIYLMHMSVQLRLAFISPQSRVVGAGDLVKLPGKIALHYFSGFFILDLFIVLPLPQVIVLSILPNSIALSGANYANNLLRSAIVVQYVSRLYRFLPLLAGQSLRGFIFESVWANFVINLLTFVLAGHVVGSFWYLFGLQRVNQCFREACHKSGIVNCMEFIDCGHGNDFGRFEADPTWNNWKTNENSSICFSEDGFPYGIYVKAVNLTAQPSIITRYIYSFFWGFQQISTLAGNQTPSYSVWEVLFTMAIIVLGLLLFALLIGNIQNFLQALGRRRMEWLLRRRDLELWISHRRLPKNLQEKVIEAERYIWSATKGFNEEILTENFPEDLQRDIRRHLFYAAMEKVGIFKRSDHEPILDAISERLRRKTYTKGGITLYQGGFVTKMYFIIRGEMVSVGKDGTRRELKEGGVCGEELLISCLERSFGIDGDPRSQRKPEYGVLSNRKVECLTNVEAFVLQVADLEEVITLFARFLKSRELLNVIRTLSPIWHAAISIQVAWKHWRKRQFRAANSGNQYLGGKEIQEEAA